MCTFEFKLTYDGDVEEYIYNQLTFHIIYSYEETASYWQVYLISDDRALPCCKPVYNQWHHTFGSISFFADVVAMADSRTEAIHEAQRWIEQAFINYSNNGELESFVVYLSRHTKAVVNYPVKDENGCWHTYNHYFCIVDNTIPVDQEKLDAINRSKIEKAIRAEDQAKLNAQDYADRRDQLEESPFNYLYRVYIGSSIFSWQYSVFRVTRTMGTLFLLHGPIKFSPVLNTSDANSDEDESVPDREASISKGMKLAREWVIENHGGGKLDEPSAELLALQERTKDEFQVVTGRLKAIKRRHRNRRRHAEDSAKGSIVEFRKPGTEE